ncbi:hypothetical protein [Xenorhabdus lircayensis]|uniref:Uncharacterized protein n=1 Tax=Xenorhabdus lircayensis TaxID=2763499 RepID=A0ABS0U8Z4_9GAMM|nr:hypothetical protein [Xenorhabdus lircayensis]MBI6550102.1 hypothetical protein [Xenorhabdus lircayensis]
MNQTFSDVVKISKSFPKELYIQRIATDKEMLIASYGQKKHQSSVEDRERVKQDIETVMADLAQKYGDDIVLLESPENSSTDKVKICEIYIYVNKKFLNYHQKERLAYIVIS